ncbi:hypothetical protein [Variovorax paradoxus]|uniref:Antitoxin Xre/MbcA/ParS-like toxin-binding domain-containing protein n=1 Tax=Variovorax paradoxus TaxID=34073 RepID=A0A679IQE0_VARPD|nr:hypothetical protein VVAX_01676 [Variovorax paradoxus]
MQAVQTRTPPAAAVARPPVHLAVTPGDLRFLDLLAAYRTSGGLATGHEISARRPLDGLSAVARAVAAREVIVVDWGGQRWLPFFQFERGDVTVRQPVRALLGELSGVLDDWDIAQWFVQPDAWLDGAQPLHLLATDFPRVHDAARALRFVCRN